MPHVFEPILDSGSAEHAAGRRLTALLIYWLFSLIRGTRAVRLVIGITVLFGCTRSRVFGLQLLTQILQTGAIVGIFALVVVFQPELRRGLERIGRVGSLGWLLSRRRPARSRARRRVVARAAPTCAGTGSARSSCSSARRASGRSRRAAS